MGNALVTTVINNVTGDSIIQDGKYNILKWAYQLARKAPAFRPGMDSAESAGLHCGG